MNTAQLDRLAEAALATKGLANGPRWWRGAGYTEAETSWALHRSLAWCGVHALTLCHETGLLIGRTWVTGHGFILRPSPLPRVEHANARAGLIAYHRTHEHHAVVAGVDATGWLMVNGNGWGGVVTVSHCDPAHLEPGEVTLFDPSDDALELENAGKPALEKDAA